MAFQTKDGARKFGSAFRAKKYDEFHKASAETPVHEAKETPEFEAGEQEGKVEDKVGQEPMHEAPHEVVAAHGKANSVHIHHDHANGKHKVVSHHEDGHMHESEHGSAGEAHDHGKQLAQADEDQLQNEENKAEGGEQDSGESILNA
jgi:hypothetical protein